MISEKKTHLWVAKKCLVERGGRRGEIGHDVEFRFTNIWKFTWRGVMDSGGANRRAGRRYRGLVYICIKTIKGRFSMLYRISLYTPISHHYVTLTQGLIGMLRCS
jgi:hypothetical protein